MCQLRLIAAWSDCLNSTRTRQSSIFSSVEIRWKWFDKWLEKFEIYIFRVWNFNIELTEKSFFFHSFHECLHESGRSTLVNSVVIMINILNVLKLVKFIKLISDLIWMLRFLNWQMNKKGPKIYELGVTLHYFFFKYIVYPVIKSIRRN